MAYRQFFVTFFLKITVTSQHRSNFMPVRLFQMILFGSIFVRVVLGLTASYKYVEFCHIIICARTSFNKLKLLGSWAAERTCGVQGNKVRYFLSCSKFIAPHCNFCNKFKQKANVPPFHSCF